MSVISNPLALLTRVGNVFSQKQTIKVDGPYDDILDLRASGSKCAVLEGAYNSLRFKGDGQASASFVFYGGGNNRSLTISGAFGGGGVHVGNPAGGMPDFGALNASELQINGVNIQDMFYPVGSVYINAVDDTNPAELLGFGEWEAAAIESAIVGAGGAYSAGETVGSNDTALTVNNIPAHDHEAFRNYGNGTQNLTGQTGMASQEYSYRTGDTGSNEPFSVEQQSEVFYIWKRVA